MQVGTHLRCTYFITFIDDLIRYFQVYLMKYKSKAFEKFTLCKKSVQKQTSFKIKTLSFDCREYIIAYIPQKNGIFERKNRTLIGVVLAILSYSNLSKIFWSKSLQTTNYLQNRSSTKSIEEAPNFIQEAVEKDDAQE
uniref:Integrase catalytic domain-containing protein n=1 Tax=Physcomitrium patens TaxID=3218 RepID=A0A2K1JD27_PHYPA|nr:hypothetical protein PHYPA_019713 [Physcomitrium patens]